MENDVVVIVDDDDDDDGSIMPAHKRSSLLRKTEHIANSIVSSISIIMNKSDKRSSFKLLAVILAIDMI